MKIHSVRKILVFSISPQNFTFLCITLHLCDSALKSTAVFRLNLLNPLTPLIPLTKSSGDRPHSPFLPYLPPTASGLSLTQTLKKPDGLPTGFLTTRRVAAVAGADAPGQTNPSSDAADAAA